MWADIYDTKMVDSYIRAWPVKAQKEKVKMSTGAYVRILRNGKWDNIDIEDLTEEEFDKFMTETCTPEKLHAWAKFFWQAMQKRIRIEEEIKNLESMNHNPSHEVGTIAVCQVCAWKAIKRLFNLQNPS